MRKSTLLGDLSRYLARCAENFEEYGLIEWAGHLQEDAERLSLESERYAKGEAPLPSIESLTGIFRPNYLSPSARADLDACDEYD